jgi:hypothetical protein
LQRENGQRFERWRIFTCRYFLALGVRSRPAALATSVQNLPMDDLCGYKDQPILFKKHRNPKASQSYAASDLWGRDLRSGTDKTGSPASPTVLSSSNPPYLFHLTRLNQQPS